DVGRSETSERNGDALAHPAVAGREFDAQRLGVGGGLAEWRRQRARDATKRTLDEHALQALTHADCRDVERGAAQITAQAGIEQCTELSRVGVAARHELHAAAGTRAPADRYTATEHRRAYIAQCQ